jgi:hypothetical protein
MKNEEIKEPSSIRSSKSSSSETEEDLERAKT